MNATGPWVDRFLDEATAVPARWHPRMVKGSHIVVPKLFDHEFAYIFQSPDGRIVFAIPYEREFTLIGTTEKDYPGDLATPSIEEPEIDYLLDMANRYFRRDLSRKDVAWTFAGLRPLLADPKDRATSVTRDYVLDLDTKGPPLLSIFGGKFTTYRKLAEDVLDELAPGAWLAAEALDRAGAPSRRRHARRGFRGVPGRPRRRACLAAGAAAAPLCARLRHAAARLLGNAKSLQELGEEVLPGLYVREIDYLRRRSGLSRPRISCTGAASWPCTCPDGSAARLDDWLARHPVA